MASCVRTCKGTLCSTTCTQRLGMGQRVVQVCLGCCSSELIAMRDQRGCAALPCHLGCGMQDTSRLGFRPCACCRAVTQSLCPELLVYLISHNNSNFMHACSLLFIGLLAHTTATHWAHARWAVCCCSHCGGGTGLQSSFPVSGFFHAFGDSDAMDALLQEPAVVANVL